MSVKRQRVYIENTYVDILGEICKEKDIPIFELLELVLDEFTTEMLKELVDERRKQRSSGGR